MRIPLPAGPFSGPEAEFVPPARRPRHGASAIEYAAIVSLITVVVIGAVQFLGGAANNTYSTVGSAVKTTQSSSTKKTTTTAKKTTTTTTKKAKTPSRTSK